MPDGTYVFCDVDRLDPGNTDIAKNIHDQLSRRGDTVRLLNSPFASLPRFPLLRSLHERGINDFNVHPVDTSPGLIRFPVFIRSSAQHKRAYSDVIDDAGKLEKELLRLTAAGHDMQSLILVEYLETGQQDLYRKYAATRLGENMIAHHIMFERRWEVKGPSLHESGMLEEERAFQLDNPHRDMLLKVFDIANIQFGRIDYALHNGRMQVWEINTNPTLLYPRDHYTEEQIPVKLWFTEQFNSSLITIDEKSPPRKYWWTRFLASDMAIRNPDHWNEHARRWQHFGSPLRPLPVDVAVAESLAEHHAKSFTAERLSAVVLGVTPELAAMQWPERTLLLGLDRCPDMIAGLWPADSVPIGAQAVRGNWNAIPCETSSVDLVVGDGCYVLLPYPEIYDGVSAEVSRVLKPDGRFSIRVFVRPEKPESPEDVISDLQEGLIGNFHAFKWRLAMSMHGSLDEGARVGDVWSYWNARKIGETTLSDRFQWSVGSIQTINAYRDVDTRYHYPTMAEIREHFSGYFEEVSCHVFNYELADRCPTFVLKPR